MDKYINQQTLQNALERKQCGPANKRYTEGWNDCLMRVKSMVSAAPIIDAVPQSGARTVYTGMMTPILMGQITARKANV